MRLPTLTGLVRLLGVGTLPHTRRLVAAAARSGAIRDLRRRSVVDRSGLMKDLRDRAKARDLLRRAAGHPATRELAGAGFMLLPVRYLPVGLAASWAAERMLRPRSDPHRRLALVRAEAPAGVLEPARSPVGGPVWPDRSRRF